MKTFVSKKLRMGMLAVALVFGMMFTACGGGGGEGNNNNPSGGDAKTLVIKDIPNSIIDDTIPDDSLIALFKVGTSLEQALQDINLDAGAYFGVDESVKIIPSGADTSTVSIPLYNFYGWEEFYFNKDRWNGSGTYDIYLTIGSRYYDDEILYIASSVNFSSEVTTVPYSSFKVQQDVP